jgi:hypothetical protein
MRLVSILDSNRTILQPITAVLGGFCFVTVVEVVCGLLTPGDYFANGSPLLLPSAIGSLVVGVYFGLKARGRWRIAIFALSFACMCYWVFVPMGWWAKALPHAVLRER